MEKQNKQSLIRQLRCQNKQSLIRQLHCQNKQSLVRQLRCQNNIKRIILVPLLVLNLVVFNFPILPALAEDTGDETTVIETGDANIGVNVENEVNTNEINSNETILEDTPEETDGTTSTEGTVIDEEPLTAEEAGTTTEESNEDNCVCPPEPCELSCQCDCGGMEVVIDNEATTTNSVEAEGDSGDNTIQDNSGDALIDTGDVNIVVGLINTVNTNITESNLSQSLTNIFGEMEEDINLGDGMDVPSEQICGSDASECLSSTTTNSGMIDNTIEISGSSGENAVTTENGSAFINTGDVNAVANILNILNTNLTGSNWTNFIINIFGEWTGDLVLPSEEKINQFSDSGSCQDCGVSVNNSSTGEVENEVAVQSDTGLNIAVGDSSIIRTGDANALSTVFNLLNTNIFGDTLFFIAVNNFGHWQGNIYSLPSGFEIGGGSDQILIYNLEAENLDNPGAISGGPLEVTNDNTGVIKNSVMINISTGSNSAIANDGNAAIQTGDANAIANLMNIMNTNIINSNMMTGIINIFGDWQGDMAFGRPDLWIGESAVSSSHPTAPGSTMTFTLSYFNNGDADATDVIITDDFDQKYLSVADPAGGTVIGNPGEIQWNIGTVPAGGTGSVSYSATVNPEIPYGNSYLVNRVIIDSLEEDWNDEDNTEVFSSEIYRTLGSLVSRSSVSSMWPVFQVTKTHNGGYFVYNGSKVDYKINLTNQGDGSGFNVFVNDTLLDESGKVFSSSTWSLGEVFVKEEIIIEYTLAIGSEIPPGTYTNVAEAVGNDGEGNLVKSPKASSVIEIKGRKTEDTILGEIENELGDIKDRIEKINEEIKRLLPEGFEADNLNDEISKILISPVSAKEALQGPEILAEDGQRGKLRKELENFLASVGAMPFNLNLILVDAGVIILILFILWLLKRRKKED